MNPAVLFGYFQVSLYKVFCLGIFGNNAFTAAQVLTLKQNRISCADRIQEETGESSTASVATK